MRDRFLVVGFDGLRVDMITPELTPNLLRLSSQGVVFRQHHAVFPTATRVNIASLVTGANSGTHGIVNNSIFEPGVSPTAPADFGKYDVVEATDAYYQGTLLHTPSVGEILAAHGDSMVAVSAGTTGSNRLMHHKVKAVGGIGFSVHSKAASYPDHVTDAILSRFGPPPSASTPDQARLAYVTDVCLDHLLPVYQPRLAILWFSDPDKTYHYCGIGSPESRQAIRAADAQLGRIMEWLQRAPQRDEVNLLVISDHGHITIRQQVSLQQALTDMGIPTEHGCFGPGDVAVVPWSAGSLHVRNHDARRIEKIITWMQTQPWCGSLFTEAKNEVEGMFPGTFAKSLVCNDHPRAGDIVYVMRSDEDRDSHGIVGGCYDDSNLPLGGGTHGGLSQHELRNLCVAYGPAFQERVESQQPSGTIDLMPTILHHLGYAIPPTVDGRILSEALAASQSSPTLAAETRTYTTAATTPNGFYQQHVTVTRVGRTTYVERGWVD
jgi:predicted AlkP superfamily pyrophosphatase or phosphodiesterase